MARHNGLRSAAAQLPVLAAAIGAFGVALVRWQRTPSGAGGTGPETADNGPRQPQTSGAPPQVIPPQTPPLAAPRHRAWPRWRFVPRGNGLLLAVAAVAGMQLWAGAAMVELRPTAASLPGTAQNPLNAARYYRTLEGDLSAPLAVAVGPNGDVYVADSGNSVVRVFGEPGLLMGTIGQRAGATPEPGDLVYPVGVAIDEASRVYVSDNSTDHISVFDAEGEFDGYFAENENGERPFGKPGSLFYRDGLLYVSDLAQHKVLALQADGTVAKTYGTGKGSAEGEFLFPGAVWVDASGFAFITDPNNHRVQVFGRDGMVRGVFQNPVFSLPRGIAGDSAGQLHIASTLGHTISVFTPLGQLVRSYGGLGGGWEGLQFPNGLAIGGDRLYIADRGNNRVQVYLLPLPGQ